MNAESISVALGHIDDDIIKAAEALRSRKKTNIQWKRWTALAACLCLVIGASVAFLQGFPILGAKCGGSPGVLVNGSYYYASDFAFYRFIPESKKREHLMSSFFVSNNGGWKVDEHGLYYIRGNSLFVREHGISTSRKLYTADTEIWIRYLDNEQITIWLRDTNKLSERLQPYVCIDVRTGQMIWERMLTDDEEYALLDSGNVYREFPIGGHILREVDFSSADGFIRELHLDGQPFVTPSENEYIEFRLEYFSSNLLITYRIYSNVQEEDYGEALGDYVYLLITPDGKTRELPSERFIAGTDNYLFYLVDDIDTARTGIQPENLYCFNIETGDASLLLDDVEIYTAVTDGTWFITNVPWSGRSDCWELIYDEIGGLVGLELWAGDI
jgi:hypothetical protein